MEEKVSKLTYPTLQHCLRMLYTTNGNSKHKSDGQSDRKSVSSELHKLILANVQKGNKLRLNKIKSAFPVKIMTFITKKFHEIPLSGFSGVALTNCFEYGSIFNCGQSFKRGITPRKKN